MGKVIKPKIYSGIFDSIKDKVIEVAADYFKKNAESVKKDVFRYIEKTIENKIKNEVRKYVLSVIGAILLAFGGLFVLFGLFDVAVTLLGLPDYMTTIVFGLFIVIVGLIVYLIK